MIFFRLLVLVPSLIVIFIAGYISINSNNILLSGIEKYADTVSVSQNNEISRHLSQEDRFNDLILFIDNQAQPTEETTLLKAFTYQVQMSDDMKAFDEFAKIPHNALAQFSLGRLHAKYANNNKQTAEAIYWTKLSAESGFVKAQHVLAIYYQRLQSYEKAYIWARCAKLNKLPAATALVTKLSTSIFLKDKQQIDSLYTPAKCKKNTEYDEILKLMGYKLS